MRSGHRRSGEKKRRGVGNCKRASRRGSARNGRIEVPFREPMRCGFGAVRVGALLGRVRLHLQTDRFLAAHRDDAVWGAGCLQAAAALAEIVSGMLEGEMDAALPTSFGARQHQGAAGTPARASTVLAEDPAATGEGDATLAAAGNRRAR